MTQSRLEILFKCKFILNLLQNKGILDANLLKAEFRFFLIDFVPFLNFHIGLIIGVGHVTFSACLSLSKKLRDWLPVLIFFFSQFKSFFIKNVLLAAQHWTATLPFSCAVPEVL